jgi:tetratricopeptide (TPR) repeat protein
MPPSATAFLSSFSGTALTSNRSLCSWSASRCPCDTRAPQHARPRVPRGCGATAGQEAGAAAATPTPAVGATRFGRQSPDWRVLSREGRAIVSRAIAGARRERMSRGDALLRAAERERTNPLVWHAAAMHHTRFYEGGTNTAASQAEQRNVNAGAHPSPSAGGSHSVFDANGDVDRRADSEEVPRHGFPLEMSASSDCLLQADNEWQTDRSAVVEKAANQPEVVAIEAAKRILEAALEAVPTGLRAALFLAKGDLATEGSKDSMASYRAGIADDKDHIPLYVAVANEYLRQGRREDARNTFRDAAKHVSDHAHVALVKAWATFEHALDNREKSRDLWRLVTELRPRDARSWRRYADAEAKLGAKPEAVAYILERAIEVHPANSELRIFLSRVLERLLGVQKARECLEHPAVQDDPFALRALATLEFREHNFDRARQMFRRASDAESEQHRVLNLERTKYRSPPREVPMSVNKNNNGDLLSERVGGSEGRNAAVEAADEQTRSASQPDHRPNGPQRRGSNVKSLHAWALMECKLGKVDVARSILKEAQAISPDDPAIWRALAELESRAKNYDESRLAFQRAIAVGGADSRLWLAWGKTENLAGNFEKAEELLQMAVRKSKQSSTFKAANERTKTFGSQSDLTSGKDTGFRSRDGVAASSSFPFATEDGDTLDTGLGSTLAARNLADALRELSSISSRNGKLEEAMRYLEQATGVDPSYEPAWRQLAEMKRRSHGIDAVRDLFSKALAETRRHVHAKLAHWWALEERSAGCVKEARDLLRRATCMQPKYMSAWLSWALLEKAEGDADRACDLFREAAKLATRSNLRAPFVFQTWGRIEESVRRDIGAGRAVFKRGHELVPESGLILQAWAALEERCGHFDVARELLSKATAAEPKLGFIWQSWALLEVRRRRYADAVRLFQRGLEHDPENAALVASWAMIEGRDLANAEKGRELFGRSIRLDPKYASAWHSWGSMELHTGNPERARELYLRAAKLAPDDPVNWHALGCLESEHGACETLPIDYFRRAVEVDPSHEISYQSWALFIERRTQDLDEARRLFELGIEKCSPDGQAIIYQAWATMELRHGITVRAREILQKGLEVDRRKVELWLTWALLEKSIGNHKVARRLFQDGARATLPVRNVAAVYAAWGSMEAEHGDLDEARSLFNQGIKINPNHVPCWRSYASMEERLGNVAKATELRVASSGLWNEDIDFAMDHSF